MKFILDNSLNNPLICVVSVSNYEICAIIVEKVLPYKIPRKAISQSFPYHVKAVGTATALGLQGHKIVDVVSFARSIEEAVGKAESQANLEIHDVYFTLPLESTQIQTCVVEKTMNTQAVSYHDFTELDDKYRDFISEMSDSYCLLLSEQYAIDGEKKDSKPIGELGHILQRYVTFCELPKHVKEQLNLLAQTLNFRKAYYCVYEFQYAQAAQFSFGQKTCFTCLDIQPNMTNVMCITDGSLRFGNQIAIGMESVIESILKQLPYDKNEMQTLLAYDDEKYELYGNILKSKNSHIKAIISDGLYDFVLALQQEITSLGMNRFIDNSSFIGLSGIALKINNMKTVIREIMQVDTRSIHSVLKINKVTSDALGKSIKDIVLEGMLRNINSGHAYCMNDCTHDMSLEKKAL